jgi:hypothetical protein
MYAYLLIIVQMVKRVLWNLPERCLSRGKFARTTFVRTTFAWRDICPQRHLTASRQVLLRANVLPGKCPCGRKSAGKCPSGKCLRGQNHTPKKIHPYSSRADDISTMSADHYPQWLTTILIGWLSSPVVEYHIQWFIIIPCKQA